jgi:hypothetical protein
MIDESRFTLAPLGAGSEILYSGVMALPEQRTPEVRHPAQKLGLL